MLMSGADERNVAAIERLTKQKFEVGTVSAQRRERDEGRGRERGEREDRGRRRRDAPPPSRPSGKPVDDFFSRPYEPGSAMPIAGQPVEAPASPITRAPGRLAALLGGRKK
jgi:hypothetical protein